MLVRVEAGHTVLPERLAMILIGQSGGRPHGTTREAGYDVGQSGDRPHGIIREAGYDVDCSRGRPCGRSCTINFNRASYRMGSL